MGGVGGEFVADLRGYHWVSGGLACKRPPPISTFRPRFIVGVSRPRFLLIKIFRSVGGFPAYGRVGGCN